jgi:hypothetical protein
LLAAEQLRYHPQQAMLGEGALADYTDPLAHGLGHEEIHLRETIRLWVLPQHATDD